MAQAIMVLWKLRLSMFATLTFVIGVSTMFFAILLAYMGAGLIFMISFIIIINIVQWLIAPRLIERIYHVKEASEEKYPQLHRMVKRISEKAGTKIPKLMISKMDIPNAFAYGSPRGGNRVAVTTELIRTLEDEEVEAVLGHELGHLKHRDVHVMMFASVLPAIFFYIGYMLFLSSIFGGRGRNAGGMILIGVAAMALYWILTLFVLGLSRLREYYADQFVVKNVPDGARKLSEGLAKIVKASGRMTTAKREGSASSSFRSLFISDPERSRNDTLAISSDSRSDQQLVKSVLAQKVTGGDRLLEIFSTHPNVVKRLKALQKTRPGQDKDYNPIYS